MSSKRDLSLSPRKENQREAQPIAPPVQFSLIEIKQHFLDSLASVKAQYEVADSLATKDNLDGCKTVWRSQVVLAEGLLDFYIHEMSKYCLFRMFAGQWDKSEKYGLFKVPMDKVEEAISATESKEWFFEYLNDRFSRDVFISKESMVCSPFSPVYMSISAPVLSGCCLRYSAVINTLQISMIRSSSPASKIASFSSS